MRDNEWRGDNIKPLFIYPKIANPKPIPIGGFYRSQIATKNYSPPKFCEAKLERADLPAEACAFCACPEGPAKHARVDGK